MKPAIKLYHYWRSSCSWRVRWAMSHKQIQYQEVIVNLLKGEQNSPSYLKINPTGSVPCIETGSTRLSESMAIIEWLEETYPQKPLLPLNSRERSLAREYAGIIQSTQAVQNLRVMKRHSSNRMLQARWARSAISEGLTAFETRLRSTAGTYCLGGNVTIADLFLIPQIYNAYRFQVDMSQYPICERIYRTCLLRPDCDQAAPYRQTGAMP